MFIFFGDVQSVFKSYRMLSLHITSQIQDSCWSTWKTSILFKEYVNSFWHIMICQKNLHKTKSTRILIFEKKTSWFLLMQGDYDTNNYFSRSTLPERYSIFLLLPPCLSYHGKLIFYELLLCLIVILLKPHCFGFEV